MTINEYFQVDLSIVWETMQSDLPALYSSLKALIRC
ncbi:HepT-like ribonuclease domain-containing protein [Thermosynechococcus sp.]